MMQTTNNILLVRPTNFGFNPETAGSNAFQKATGEDDSIIRKRAIEEFEAALKVLREAGVSVIVCDDSLEPVKTDAVFPNNWISCHADGKVVLYPLLSPNRRHERRTEIIEILRGNFVIDNIIDLTHFEGENKFLEGTGSVVFDHENKIAYAALSPRTHEDVLQHLCEALNYESAKFRSHDANGVEIYHTNVMMCIGKRFSVVCLDSITVKTERKLITDKLYSTGHAIIDITFEQMNSFAGNMLEVKSSDGNSLLVMSQTAHDSLTGTQRTTLESYCTLVPLAIPTIETVGGGSARCMIAEVFLQPRSTA
jgi:hypothetical protein